MIKEAEIEQVEDDSQIDNTLSPLTFNEYIGQESFKSVIGIAISAAKERREPLPSVLISGLSGYGKSTIAQIIANEMGSNCKTVVAGAIKTPADLLEIITKLEHGDIFFCDEIHQLNQKMEEALYSAMENYQVDIKLADNVVRVSIKPFTLIGATTEIGKLSEPFRNRFVINQTLQPYTDDELFKILDQNIPKLELIKQSDEAVYEIAKRARGVPRVANNMLKRVRDYIQVKNNNIMTVESVRKAFELEGIDEDGLSRSDRDYLIGLLKIFKGGPVGVRSIASSIGLDILTVEKNIEPLLISKNLIARSPKGRSITGKGIAYIREYIKEK